MTGADVYLWPMLVFLVLGTLGAAWQARNPEREIAARKHLLEQNLQAPRWRQMSLWDQYRATQNDPVREGRSARRRATVLGVAAVAVAMALALGV